MTKQQKTVAKILEVKEFTKEQLEAETRNARERLRVEEERLVVLEQEFKDRDGELTRKQTEGTIAVHEIGLYFTYLKHLTRQIDQQKGIVAIRARELEDRQQAMVDAYREQRLLEKLQDKLQQEQDRELLQGEQKEADYQYLTRKKRE
jgi:flagellar export protein FliJ